MHLPAMTKLPPFLLQLLARVVVKEVRACYGCMARKRGYVQRGMGMFVGHGRGIAVLSTILVSCSSSVQLTESVLDGK